MHGYAASARIERIVVRPRPAPLVTAIRNEHVTRVEDRPAGRSLAELLDDWRVLWAQTTFFLFDPQSWR